MSILSIQRDIPSIDPEFVFSIGNFAISNTTTVLFLVVLMSLIGGVWFRRSLSVDTPNGVQLFFEMFYDYVMDFVEQITGKSKHFDRIFPVITAMFAYLLVSNLLMFIPGLGEIMIGDISLFKTPTADFNTTFGLALGVVFAVQIVNISENGILSYLGNYIRFHKVFSGFRKGMGSGVTGLIDMFIGLLDIVGEFAKVISLSLRLFGNMLAGNILATILLGAFSLVIPIVWTGMSLFFGVLQALVFVALSGGYYMLAVSDEEE